MIVGHKNLVKMFPSFKDDIAENGIDLRVGKIYKLTIDEDKPICGCVDNIKILPNFVQIKDVKGLYDLRPNEIYSVEIDRPIKIPNGYCQLYKLRSTFARCGLLLISAVGDDSYNGTLRFTLKNLSNFNIQIGANERIVQAVTFENDGSAIAYNGSYQDDNMFI